MAGLGPFVRKASLHVPDNVEGGYGRAAPFFEQLWSVSVRVSRTRFENILRAKGRKVRLVIGSLGLLRKKSVLDEFVGENLRATLDCSHWHTRGMLPAP